LKDGDFYFKIVARNSLDDSDLVGDVQGVEVGCQPDVGLLLTVGSKENYKLKEKS
jgi:hypothetical protein